MPIAPGEDILADDVLSVAGTPICKLRQAAVQSIADNVTTKLTFAAGSEDNDDLGWHDVTTNNTRITPDRVGWYEVGAILNWQGPAIIQYCNVQIYKNGTAVETSGNVQLPPDANQTTANHWGGSITMPMTVDTVGDYFEMAGFHRKTAAAAQNTNGSAGGTTAPRFWVRYLGPL